jgi:hypothetical protein
VTFGWHCHYLLLPLINENCYMRKGAEFTNLSNGCGIVSFVSHIAYIYQTGRIKLMLAIDVN